MGSKRSEIKEENPLQELLNAIISSLESLEARIEAVYQFLKAKGGASDKDLAPFLEQSANASNVRWRAFRVRAEALIAGALKDREKESKAEQSEPESESRKPQATESEKAETQDDTKATQTKAQTDETLAAKNPAKIKNDAEPEAQQSKSQTREDKTPSQAEAEAKDQAKDQASDTAASKPEAPQKNPSVQQSGPDEPTARGKSTTEVQPNKEQSNEGQTEKRCA